MSGLFRLPTELNAVPSQRSDRVCDEEFRQQCRDEERSQVVRYLRGLATEASVMGLGALAGQLLDVSRRICEGEHVEGPNDRV